MTRADPALVDRNQKHQEFWAHQYSLMEKRLTDPNLVKAALKILASEIRAGTPVQYRLSFEAALEMAELEKLRSRLLLSRPEVSPIWPPPAPRLTSEEARSELARVAGKAKKPDPLQLLIVDIVRAHPAIGWEQLVIKIRGQERGPVIMDVDQKHIHYRIPVVCKRGRDVSKKSPISGLKHRLTRARKAIQSESRSR